MAALLAKIGLSILGSFISEDFIKEFLVHSMWYAAKKYNSDYWEQIAKDVAKNEGVVLS